VFKPVQMAKIAIMGLRKNQQTSVSILHDMEILQLEPLSKDILDLVDFIISPNATYITGQNIEVAGGYMMSLNSHLT